MQQRRTGHEATRKLMLTIYVHPAHCSCHPSSSGRSQCFLLPLRPFPGLLFFLWVSEVRASSDSIAFSRLPEIAPSACSAVGDSSSL